MGCICAIWIQSEEGFPRYRQETKDGRGRTARHAADNITIVE